MTQTVAIVVGSIEVLPYEHRPYPDHMGTFRWTLENYSTYEDKRVLYSPTFEKGGYAWRLWLFPKGSINATEGDMSIFLHYIKKDDVFSLAPTVHPRAKFSIKINNQLEGEDVQHEIFDFHDFGESNGEWGWKDFADIDRLFEEESGLVLNNILEVELNVFVQPKSRPLWPTDASDETKSIIVRILTDQQLKREIGILRCRGLPLFDEGRSYCFYEHMRFNQLEKLLTRDLRINPEDRRLWLCEQLPHSHIRIIKNLNVQNLSSIGDLAELKNQSLPSLSSESIDVVTVYVELPDGDQETVKALGVDDYVAFCKYYDPWKMTLTYIGTVPLRKGCTSAEVIMDTRMLTGLQSTAAVEVFVEAPPGQDPLRQLHSEDDIDAVGLQPGGTLIIQPKVEINEEGLEHPSVVTYLTESKPRCRSPGSEASQFSQSKAEPHEDVCVVCLSRPRTVGFLHGNSLHRCCCKDCAPQLVKNDTGNCPMCRKKIDRVVLNIF